MKMAFSSGSCVAAYRAVMCSLPVAFATLFLATVGPASPAMAAGCVAGQEARALLERGEAIPFPEALQRAGYSGDQLAGGPQLCEAGGRYVYRVKIVEQGQVQSVTIPAN
jgi:hypothetical protein